MNIGVRDDFKAMVAKRIVTDLPLKHKACFEFGPLHLPRVTHIGEGSGGQRV